MDYNEITKEFGGTIKKPLQLSAKDLAKEFGGNATVSQPIGQTNYDMGVFFSKQRLQPDGSYASIEDSWGGKLFKALTSGEKALGETLGQSLAVNTKPFTELEKSRQGMSDMQLKVVKEINAKKARGEDTSRLESILSKSVKQEAPSIQEIAPATTKTNLQVLGELGQVATDIASVGTLKPIATGMGLARTAEVASKGRQAFSALSTGQKLKKIAIDTLKLAGKTTPFGYAYDVSTNLQEGKAGQEALTPGAGTLFSTVIPLSVGSYRAGKVLSKPILDYAVGNLSGKGVPAAQQLSKGGSEFLGVTPQEVFDDTRKSLALYDNSVSNTFGATKKTLIDQFTGQRVGIGSSDAQALRKVATEFGFADRLPNNLANMSVKETMDLLGEINAKGRTKISPFDIPSVRTSKYTLAQLKGAIKERAVQMFGGKGGDFDKAYATYSKAQGVIQDMENIVGSVSKFKRLTPTTLKTAQNRLMKVFKDDTQAYINAIKSFESVTGERILDKVAAANFSELMPRALKSGDTMLGSYANDLIGLLTFPLSSPKVGANLISIASGYKPSVVTSLLNASPKIRQTIYDAVVKENKSLDEAMTNAIETYGKIPNKQGGFVRIGNGAKQRPSQSMKSTQNIATQDKSIIPPTIAKPAKNTVIINPISKSSNKAEIKASTAVDKRQSLNTLYRQAEEASEIIPLSKIIMDNEVLQAAKDVQSGIKSKSKLPILAIKQSDGRYVIEDGKHRLAELSKNNTDFLAITDEKLYRKLAAKEEELNNIGRTFKQNPKTGKMAGSIKADPLIQEAKKYKSAEEFVKAQPIVYHGTKINGTKTISGDALKPSKGGTYGGGVYFSKDKSLIEETYGKGGSTIPLVGTEKLKVYTSNVAYRNDLIKYTSYKDVLKTPTTEQQMQLIKKLLKEGYEGIYDNRLDYGVIFNPKTKSQLTDIWNKANKK